MKNFRKMSKSTQHGFSLVEVMFAVALALVVASFAAPMFTSFISETRLSTEVGQIEALIRDTVSESMARGAVGQIVITSDDNSLVGQVLEPDGDWLTIASTDLEFASFGRWNTTPTPWLNITEEVSTSFENDTIDVTSAGMINSSGALFVKYRNTDAVIEVLSSGRIAAFSQGAGDDSWFK